LIRETEPFGLWLAFSYDAAGNTTGVQDSFGGDTVSTYNAQGQLVSRQLTAPGEASIGVTLDYTADGEVNTLTRSAGGSTVGSSVYSYDTSGDVTGIAHLDASGNVLDGFLYAYDAAGQVTSESDFGEAENPVGPIAGVSSPDVLDAAILASMESNGSTSGGSSTSTTTGGSSSAFTGLTSPTNYSYDADGQLIGSGSQTYQYDANGNRINPGYVIGPDNQLLSDGTWDYTYDPDGNEIGKVDIATGVSWSYGYDDANQMTSATEYAAVGSQTILAQVTYTYDVFGNRLQQTTYTASTSTTTVQRYGYNGQNVWVDLNSSNQLETRYLDGDAVDQILARVGSTGVVAWYLTDDLGSVRDLMNNSGAIIDHRNYDAFGNITYETNPAAGDRYGYTGREFDITTGLQYNRARYYDPKTGRWTSQDTDGFNAGDTNLYRYAENQATDLIDPLGEFGEPGLAAMGANQGGALNPNNVTNQEGRPVDPIMSEETKTRLDGAKQIAGGVGLTVSTVLLAATPEPTGLTKAGAVATGYLAADNFQTGFRKLIYGEPVDPLTTFVVMDLAQKAGATEYESRAIAESGFNAASFLGSLPGPALAKSPSVARSVGGMTSEALESTVILEEEAATIGNVAPNGVLRSGEGVISGEIPGGGIGRSTTTSELLSGGSLPGQAGVTLDQGVVRFSDIHQLSLRDGAEYVLTREGGQYVLRSGLESTVSIPMGVRPIVHTHPPDIIGFVDKLPSRSDINVLNSIWARNPNGARPVSQIIWGSGPGETTVFRATGIDLIPKPKGLR
jgi:RHS repeat-associated protein